MTTQEHTYSLLELETQIVSTATTRPFGMNWMRSYKDISSLEGKGWLPV